MLVSSILNSITFKNLSGSYPNKENTLHANRFQSGKKTIPYFQKFHSGHTVYLQFESDISADVTLSSYIGTVQIETITRSYESHYGTSNSRYYFNFTIILDGDYIEKKVTFKAVQGSFTLTSEPVLATDLTDKISKGLIKYIQYSNNNRIESDISDRFIDWSVIENDGHFMDMFIEAIDIEPNDSDEVEVLEGSQSYSITSSTYYNGVVLSTGGIPDYMASKLGNVSSLDYFAVNGLRYVKNGEISMQSFGQSTLLQCSLKLKQKYAVGSNIDITGDIIPDPEPPVNNLVAYIGVIQSGSVLDEAAVKSMTQREDLTLSAYSIYQQFTNPQLYCFAYPSYKGSLRSILSGYDPENEPLAGVNEIITGFRIVPMVFAINDQAVDYTVYILRRAVTNQYNVITFKF